METKHSIAKNYILNLVYQIVAVCVPIITTPYVSRVLQPDGIGAYSYTFSIAMYFSMFASLGVATYGQLEIAKHRDNKVLISKLFFEIMVARLLTTILMLWLYNFSMPIFGIYPVLYRIMAVFIVAEAVDISWFFQGLEQFKVTFTRNFVIKIISTLCIFTLIKNKEDLALYTLILQGSSFFGNILLWPYLKKFLVKVNIHKIKFYRHWKESLMYFIPTVATSVYTVLDKSMIGLFTKSSVENGYYEQAHKIEQILLVFLISLGTVTLPRLVYVWNKGDKRAINGILSKSFNFILMLSFPMMFGVCAVADKLVPVFLGDGYEPCISLLRVFSILLVVIGLDNLVGKQCLVATGRQNLFNRGVIAGAVVNLVSNIILIRWLGSLGAAFGTVIAECTILTAFLYYSKDVFRPGILISGCLRYSTVGSIMGIVVWWIGKHVAISVAGIIIQIMIGVLIYFLLLILIKEPMLKTAFKMMKRS